MSDDPKVHSFMYDKYLKPSVWQVLLLSNLVFQIFYSFFFVMSGDTSSNVFGKNGNVVLVRIQEIQDEYDRRIISSINGFIFYRFRTRSTVDTTTSEKNFWQRLFAKCESASSNEKTSLRSLVKRMKIIWYQSTLSF